MICQAIEQLSAKAQFLQEMVFFELYDDTQNLTCRPYKYRTELRFLVFKVVQELKEVIEIFSTSEFLKSSASRGSDEHAV